jgi:hypothetical protein
MRLLYDKLKAKVPRIFGDAAATDLFRAPAFSDIVAIGGALAQSRRV